MSKGPGEIERRIAELFATDRPDVITLMRCAQDRPLSVTEIADYAFDMGGGAPTRAQRLSATRAAHRLLRRMRETDDRVHELRSQAHREARAAGASEVDWTQNYRFGSAAFNARYEASSAYRAILEETASWKRAEKLNAWLRRFGLWVRILKVDENGAPLGPGKLRGESEFWRATLDASGTLYFHPPNVPVRVWAVSVERAGVIWVEVEAINVITERFVSVTYAGEKARLDREALWKGWAVWRGVKFVANRSGHAAKFLDDWWQDLYGRAAGGVPPVMQMPLAEARALLGVPANFTKDDVIAAFRREVKKAHPDVGGTEEMFRKLLEARDRLLASLGTSAPAPRPPRYTPKGVVVKYTSVKLSGAARIGSTRRLR
jgi:hypothetical protein